MGVHDASLLPFPFKCDTIWKVLPTQHVESTVWAGGGAPHAHRHGQLGAQDVGVARLNAGKAACLGHQDVVAADLLGMGAIPGEDISLWCRSSFSLSPQKTPQ